MVLIKCEKVGSQIFNQNQDSLFNLNKVFEEDLVMQITFSLLKSPNYPPQPAGRDTSWIGEKC